MATNFELRRGGEYYYGEGRFVELNKRIDRILHSVFGDFHWEGPRNWLGSTYEGAWTRVNTDLDKMHILPFLLFALIPFLFLSLVTGLETKGLFYMMMIAIFAVGWVINYMNPQAPLEFMSHGTMVEYMRYIKSGTQGFILWTLLYLGVGQLAQQAIIPYQAVSIGWGVDYLTVIVIPYIEVAFFFGLMFATLSRYIGVILGVLGTSLIRGGFHSIVFQADPISIFMSVMFGVIIYPIAASKFNKDSAIIAHIQANLLAFILASLGIVALTVPQLMFAVVIGAIIILILRRW